MDALLKWLFGPNCVLFEGGNREGARARMAMVCVLQEFVLNTFVHVALPCEDGDGPRRAQSCPPAYFRPGGATTGAVRRACAEEGLRDGEPLVASVAKASPKACRREAQRKQDEDPRGSGNVLPFIFGPGIVFSKLALRRTSWSSRSLPRCGVTRSS